MNKSRAGKFGFRGAFTEHGMRSLILGLAALVVTSPFAQAGDITAGRTVMAKCQGCHGKDGLSTSISSPNLAGQREHYLILSLRKYKAGKRESPMMTSALKSLSDEDMVNVAAYYAAIKIIVEVPK
jgi:cytochrome c553